jgi:hypothetical protein
MVGFSKVRFDTFTLEISSPALTACLRKEAPQAVWASFRSVPNVLRHRVHLECDPGLEQGV